MHDCDGAGNLVVRISDVVLNCSYFGDEEQIVMRFHS